MCEKITHENFFNQSQTSTFAQVERDAVFGILFDVLIANFLMTHLRFISSKILQVLLNQKMHKIIEWNLEVKKMEQTQCCRISWIIKFWVSIEYQNYGNWKFIHFSGKLNESFVISNTLALHFEILHLREH